MYRTSNEQKRLLLEKLAILFFMLLLLLAAGTFVYHFTEGWSYLDSLYFSVISLTSRGFSELHPTGWASVLFSVFYLIIGVSILIYALSSLVAYYTSFYQERVHTLVRTIKKKPRDRWVILSPRKA